MARQDSDAVKLEGMIATVTVIKPTCTDLAAISRDLHAKIEGLPDFFEGAPVAIDLGELDGSDDLEEPPPLAPLSLGELLAALRALGLTPVGVRGLRRERAGEARELGLQTLRGSAARARKPPREAAPSDDEAAAVRARGTLTLRQPVRGGQVVYAESGDAVALSSVNAGGELIADGHVHVYGALRGRALAGAHGDTTARIFCQSLEAELVSVAGTYLNADELPEGYLRRPVQIYLEGESLVITDLLPPTTSSHT